MASFLPNALSADVYKSIVAISLHPTRYFPDIIPDMEDAVKLIFSLIVGAAIGLEREIYENKADRSPKSGIGSLGVRSYILISVMGTAVALSSRMNSGLFIFASTIFGLLLLMYYYFGSVSRSDHGLTTELAILATYLLGAFIGFGIFDYRLIIAMSILLIFILNSKQEIRDFVRKIKERELDAFLSYAIVALIVLPVLPDINYSLRDIPFLRTMLDSLGMAKSALANTGLINPFGVWRVVALITGIDILGYLLVKTLGQNKGWLLASATGGFISSTSTTQSLALQSKKTKNDNRLIAAAVIANLSSFIQLVIFLASFNTVLLVRSISFIAALSLSALSIALFWLTRTETSRKKNGGSDAALNQTKIFSIGPALRFAFLFMLVKIISKVALIFFGNIGFIAGNLIGASTGLDAVTLNISELAGRSINYDTALLTLFLANAVNLFAKSIYSYLQGSRSFALKFFLSILVMVILSAISLLF